MLKHLLRNGLIILLALILMSTSAWAGNWPQFFGDPDSQGISNGQSAVKGSDLALRWEKRTGAIDSNGNMVMTWFDIPGSPIVVGNYVYSYSSQYLRKIDLASGEELAKVQVYGEKVNQFFINLCYGDGKIYVPCQVNNMNDNTGVTGCFLRVFDAETLEQLYVTESLAKGQMQSPVMYHDGHFVTGTYGRNGVYACFTAEDEDPSRSDEVKKAVWTVNSNGKYGFSFNGAAFVGDYCYFGYANTLYVVAYKTGDVRTFTLDESCTIHSTITYSEETERIYVAASHSTGGSTVLSYELKSDGIPKTSSERQWISNTAGGATQSSPVVYNGRLYIGGGGSTMGSAEPFHVIDAVSMKEIYSVPVLSKGTASVTTAYAAKENKQKVYIYMVPFSPNAAGNAELWIISDCEGQTEASYEVVENIGRGEYCSQSVIIADDGSLIWYNDAGALYCYENTLGLFTDTTDHWGKSYITALARRGIINGMGDGTFAPENTVTRAHFVQMLAKMSGEDYASCTTNVYSDVGSEWYAPAIAWAAQRKIADTDTGKFAPNDPITREDMALMLYRYATNVAKASLPQKKDPVSFTDSAAISSAAADAVAAMQRCGIIDGMPDGDGYRFAPAEQATRAQAAAMITRFYNAINEQG